MRTTPFAYALVGVLLLAGCATSNPPSAPPATLDRAEGLKRPLIPIQDPQLLELCPEMDAIYYPEMEVPLEAVEGYTCVTDFPSEQTTAYRINNLEELLAAYNKPNAVRSSDTACIEMAADPLIVWLHTADSIIAVAAPVDICGFPQPEAQAAFEALELERLEA